MDKERNKYCVESFTNCGKKHSKPNTRALSPIFATLIILAVVTVLFIPVFIWATNTSGQTQESWAQAGLTATERIVLEEVSLIGNQPQESCTIYVRNIGETVIRISGVIISDSNDNLHTYQTLAQVKTFNPRTGQPLTSITKGDLIEIQIQDLAIVDSSFRLTNHATYTIKVFTSRGVSDSYQVQVSW